jgi:hypothetical protein
MSDLQIARDGGELYVRWYNDFGHKMIASEACGGVVESNMVLGTDRYLGMTLIKYLENLCGIKA